jgi:hypothetical protein
MSLALPFATPLAPPRPAVAVSLRLVARFRLYRRARTRRRLAAVLDFRDPRLRADVGLPAAGRCQGFFAMLIVCWVRGREGPVDRSRPAP